MSTSVLEIQQVKPNTMYFPLKYLQLFYYDSSKAYISKIHRFKSNSWSSWTPSPTNGPGFKITYIAEDCKSDISCGQGNSRYCFYTFLNLN